MLLNILKGIVFLVILVIAFECVVPVFCTTVITQNNFTFNTKKAHPSMLNRIAFEKAEEEPTEEEHEIVTVEIVDLTRIATTLAQVHSPQLTIRHYKETMVHHPSLFKMHSVFLI